MTRNSQLDVKTHDGKILIDTSTPEGCHAVSSEFAFAEFVLKLFCQSVRAKEVPPQEILEFLEEGFSA